VDTFSSVATMFASVFAVTRFARIRRFGLRFRPDVVYYPGGHAWKPILDLLLPRSAKVVLTVHDPVPHPGEDNAATRLFAWSNRLRVDGYVLLNETQRQGFIDRYRLDPVSVAMVPLGVFDDLVHDVRPLADVPGLERLDAIEGRYLLFVGRIQRYKGVGTLLEAYGSIATGIRAPLVIAGAGSLTPDEMRRIADLGDGSVTVVNRWLSDTEIASLVAAARFVVLPYTSATQSGVIPLASAFGVPAIASDAGGLVEQVVDGRTGLLCRAGDVASLADALARASTMEESERAAMSARCREHAATEWAWDSLAARLDRFFMSLGGG
jgi:glycosyltransferase involved in cell wall biosynthesis